MGTSLRKLLAVVLALAAALLAVLAGAGIAVFATHTYRVRFVGYTVILTFVSAAGAWWLFRMSRTQWNRGGAVFPKVLFALILLVVAAASALGVRHTIDKVKQQHREMAYQSVLRSYADVMKPGMSRKEVEDYLTVKNIGFRQMYCVDRTQFSKGVYDDLTRIGEEEAPWFCSYNNVYVAFQFTGPKRPDLSPTAAPADTLREVSLYRWLEGCL